MTDIKFTKRELKQFDRLTRDMCSHNQVKRISARMDMNKFVDTHGNEKCQAMKSELVKQGKW